MARVSPAEVMLYFNSPYLWLWNVLRWICRREHSPADQLFKIAEPLNSSQIDNFNRIIDGNDVSQTNGVSALLGLKTALEQGRVRATGKRGGKGRPMLLPLTIGRE